MQGLKKVYKNLINSFYPDQQQQQQQIVQQPLTEEEKGERRRAINGPNILEKCRKARTYIEQSKETIIDFTNIINFINKEFSALDYSYEECNQGDAPIWRKKINIDLENEKTKNIFNANIIKVILMEASLIKFFALGREKDRSKLENICEKVFHGYKDMINLIVQKNILEYSIYYINDIRGQYEYIIKRELMFELGETMLNMFLSVFHQYYGTRRTEELLNNFIYELYSSKESSLNSAHQMPTLASLDLALMADAMIINILMLAMGDKIYDGLLCFSQIGLMNYFFPNSEKRIECFVSKFDIYFTKEGGNGEILEELKNLNYSLPKFKVIAQFKDMLLHFQKYVELVKNNKDKNSLLEIEEYFKNISYELEIRKVMLKSAREERDRQREERYKLENKEQINDHDSLGDVRSNQNPEEQKNQNLSNINSIIDSNIIDTGQKESQEKEIGSMIKEVQEKIQENGSNGKDEALIDHIINDLGYNKNKGDIEKALNADKVYEEAEVYSIKEVDSIENKLKNIGNIDEKSRDIPNKIWLFMEAVRNLVTDGLLIVDLKDGRNAYIEQRINKESLFSKTFEGSYIGDSDISELHEIESQIESVNMIYVA